MKKGFERMLADIRAEVEYTRSMTGRTELATEVMEAMATVPRDKFVPENMKSCAWDNGALPIGYGQTISQPYIVALMTDMLKLSPSDTVLEIGTGSGYQTAVLSMLAEKVYTIERVEALAHETGKRLEALGYGNIETRIGNGYDGWPENAPYNAIIVTAAATHIPAPLIDQLIPGGRMAIPVGMPHGHQELMLVEKLDNGEIRTTAILAVAFVPLVADLPEESETRH